MSASLGQNHKPVGSVFDVALILPPRSFLFIKRIINTLLLLIVVIEVK